MISIYIPCKEGDKTLPSNLIRCAAGKIAYAINALLKLIVK